MEIEKELGERDLIVSSTDKNGIINYVNATFSNISRYTKDELYGKPHNIIRHPDMPKTIFRYAWDKILKNTPVVAYVKNYVKGKKEFYWVKAVIYPKVVNGEIEIITSYRTKAKSFEIKQIKEIYKKLIEYEKSHSVDESMIFFTEYLAEKKLTYDMMINRLNDNQQILNTALLRLDINKFKSDHLIFRSRIESLVEKGYENIEVTKPNCCAFGKRLIELENEPFAKDSKFFEIKKIHEKIHDRLEVFANSNEDSSKASSMQDVYTDIDSLFELMESLKNDHKYDETV
ncbi:PAS domain S-box protein [Sulfurimonas sp.]